MTDISIQDKLRQRKRLIGTTITNFHWTGIIPAFRKRNIDFVLFDLEHQAFDWTDVEAMLHMCNMVDLTAFVRVTDIAYHQISKVLDLGADGLLIPRLESVEQLEQVIEMVRLPPRGKKGVGGYDFGRAPLQDTLAQYNTTKMIWAQIESPAGISQLDAMLQTREVSGVIVGPTDLSVAMGIPMQFTEPAFIEAVKEVIQICDHHQISCGKFMDGNDDMTYWCREGMNVIWSGSDVGFLTSGFNRWCDMVEEIE